MTSFFEQYGRKLFEMVGDGNCFYRGISYQLFGTQEEHSTIRSVVSHMENLNKIFSPYLISGWNKPTIAEQIFHVSTPGTWATHVEVLATASVLKYPLHTNLILWKLFAHYLNILCLLCNLFIANHLYIHSYYKILFKFSEYNSVHTCYCY